MKGTRQTIKFNETKQKIKEHVNNFSCSLSVAINSFNYSLSVGKKLFSCEVWQFWSKCSPKSLPRNKKPGAASSLLESKSWVNFI